MISSADMILIVIGNLSTVDGLVDFIDRILDFLLEAVHTCYGKDMGQTEEDDADADERRERDGGDFHILKAEDAEHDTDDAQKQKRPPVLEAHFLVVEAQDYHANTLNDYPNGEHKRE